MKVTKTMRVGSVTIPAGANIAFSTEGYAIYKGVKISRRQVAALEADAEPTDAKPVDIQSEFTAEVSEQFFAKHADMLMKYGIQYRTGNNITLVTFSIPETTKAAKVLCRLLTQEGHDADQIALLCPELARKAGLVDDAYLNALLSNNEIIGAKWSRHEEGGVEAHAGTEAYEIVAYVNEDEYDIIGVFVGKISRAPTMDGDDHLRVDKKSDVMPAYYAMCKKHGFVPTAKPMTLKEVEHMHYEGKSYHQKRSKG